MEKAAVLLVVGLFLAGSAWVTWRALRTINRLDKYEFENRTDGGVVQFDSNSEAVRHKNKRMGADSLMKLGCLSTFLSGAAFLILLFFGLS
jgi:hypothetical protein